MTAAPWGRLETQDPIVVLGDALAYARSALLAVTPSDLARPTPCAGWTLGRLLRHLDDSLDAFTEAGELHLVTTHPHPRWSSAAEERGGVSRPPTTADPNSRWSSAAEERGGVSRPPSTAGLCEKACSLHRLWAAATHPDQIGVDDLALPTDLLIQTAALEVAVHGWDVGRTVTGRLPFPDSLAADLLPVALDAVGLERGDQFGPPLPVTRTSPPGERLLAHLGRHAG